MWSELSTSPGSWMLEECYPEGFSWVDPSKLRNAQVFQLLDHWRQREEDGLDPIVWNPQCKAFAGIETRQRRKRSSSPESESPHEQREASSSSTPRRAFSDRQSEEENFDNDLWKIMDKDTSSSDHSPSPSPPPLPRRNVDALGPSEPGKQFRFLSECLY